MVINMIKFPKLYIAATLQCNLACKYCPQTLYNKTDPKFTEDMKKYLQNLDSDTHEVAITGGEPLLCWDKVKEIFSYIPNDINKTIITNGTLLTQDIVDYVNMHNIKIQLSYNGKTTEFLCGIDVLQDTTLLNLIQQINNLKISLLVTKYNNDVWENYFDTIAKLGKNVMYSINLVGDNQDLQDMINTFDYNLAVKTQTEFNNSNFYIPDPSQYKSNMNNQQKRSKLNFTVLLNGDIYNLATNTQFGTVFDGTYDNFIDAFLQSDYFKKCAECEYCERCQNGCNYISNHTCRYYQTLIKFNNIFLKDRMKFKAYVNNKLPQIEDQYKYNGNNK